MGSRWQQDYIRFSGEVVAVENNPALPAQPCATCYLSYDHLGSVRMVTDGSGTVKAFHDYAPFGQEIPAGVGGRTALWGGSDSASQRFTGQVRDTETGLDFFNARYLSSGMGRFMSVDPGNAGADGADPQTWNGYGYVRNTPLSLVDPSGMNDTNPGQPSDPFDPCWDPYSVGNDSPCWGVGGGVGGSSGGGGGGGGRVPSGAPTASGGGAWPPGSFPGGENLGLPPGMNVPGPLTWQALLGIDSGCEFGPCSFTDQGGGYVLFTPQDYFGSIPLYQLLFNSRVCSSGIRVRLSPGGRVAIGPQYDTQSGLSMSNSVRLLGSSTLGNINTSVRLGPPTVTYATPSYRGVSVGFTFNSSFYKLGAVSVSFRLGKFFTAQVYANLHLGTVGDNLSGANSCE